MIERLIECFTEDFTQWLLKSNNPNKQKKDKVKLCPF